VLVPDFPERNLSGELSCNKYFKGKVEYIGILSHIKKRTVKEDIDYFFSLSGPEPQRTMFEEKILEQVPCLNGRIVIAGGNPDIDKKVHNEKVKLYSHLNSKKQEEMMNRAKIVVTRSGYTTVMELAELEKNKVLLIPMPGMTEQEYIADLYEKKQYFHHVHQSKFNLNEDLKKIDKFSGFKAKWKTKDSVARVMKLIS
jgi:UDP-N-acetylglucosamine transferase subunit ALG13